jgi:outer membrane protein assembly factor BamB
LFAQGKEPVITTKFKDVSGIPANPFALTVTSNADNTLSVVITIFGDSTATLSARHLLAPAAATDEAVTSTTNVGSNQQAAMARKSGKASGTKNARHTASVLQYDLERTGYISDGKSLPKRPRIVWKYPPEGKGTVARPGDSIVDGPTLYFGDEAGQLHALDSADGNEKWARDCGPNAIVAAPAAADRKLYVASTKSLGCFACETGKPIWTKELPDSFGESSPLLVGDTVIVGCGDGFVRAFDRKAGNPVWEADLISDRPADVAGYDSQFLRRDKIAARMRSAAADGNILVQTIYDQSRAVALDCRSGQRRWTYGTRGWIATHPAIAGDFVLFGSHDVYLHCVNRLTGKLVWKFPCGAELDAAPAVANGRVYFNSRNARLHCLDLESGQSIWMHRMDPGLEGGNFTCAPTVTDDRVYIGSTNGFLVAIDTSTGDTRWAISVADNMPINGFALATDGKRLFATSRSNSLPSGPSGITAVGD